MASALAHPIFRTSSIEQGLHVNGITDEATHYHGSADHRLPSSLPPAPMFLKDISRSSSGSTQGSIGMVYQPNFHTRSASLSQGRVEEYNRQQQHQQNRGMLPGLSTLASLASTKEPYMRSFPAATAMGISFGQMVPALTPGVSGNNNLPPVCQNCETSTTPLWRRDESGAVLCNACGLFLKLHGRPRPISLKTDVIKSRNRVKSANQGPKKQMSLPASQSTDVNGLHNGAHRRVSQIGAQTFSQRSQSPISRTGTPSMHHDPNIAPQHMFDGVALHDHAFQTPVLPALPHLGSQSSLHDRTIESGPLTYEELVASNNVLRTRVSELEVINMMYTDNENNLRRERDEAVQAREDLKRRVDELERQLGPSENEPPHKRARIADDAAENTIESLPPSAPVAEPEQ